jgi:hypothetical protein
MPTDRLRLEDLSDRELLLVVDDMADADGYADAWEVGLRLGLEQDHARRIVTSRLSWLRRWGAVEREPADNVPKVRGEPRRPRRWMLTALGHDMATGRLRKAQQQALEGARDADLLALTGLLAQRQRHGGLTVRSLMRREWQYQTHYRRNGGP